MNQPTESTAPSSTAPKPAGAFSSSQTRPARPTQTRLPVPGEALAPRPGLPAPFPSSPGPGSRQRAAREGGRAGGRPRPPAPRSPTRARRTHRPRAGEETPPERGASNDGAASAPCAPPSWEAGQAAHCVITSASQGHSARGRGPCCLTANEKRQPPPPRPIPSPSAAAKREKQAGDVRS